MTVFNEIAEKTGDDQWIEWKERILDATNEIAAFVACSQPGREAKVVDWFEGSFNFCLKGQDIQLFGTNEVQIIKFLREQITIPVLHLISWGFTEECPQQFGPFIISDFAEGVHLSDILKDPTNPERLYLDPKINTEVLDDVFEQIADIMLQFFQFNFPCIGTISNDITSNTWSVIGRPLTYSMNELANTTVYPIEKFDTSPFESARDYFKSLTCEHMTHLWVQRNISTNAEDAQERYIARHLFAQLVDQYCIDDCGSFKPFCDDFRPQNILVGPQSHRIIAVLNLEFTNAMPSQHSLEPPWWSLLAGPDSYLFS